MSGSAAWRPVLLLSSARSWAQRRVQHRNSDGWGNNKQSFVFRKGEEGGGGLRGIFGIVQHHSSLVQDAFFSEVWPARQTDHCQGKDDHHTHREVAVRAGRRAFLPPTDWQGRSATQPATTLISINGRGR